MAISSRFLEMLTHPAAGFFVKFDKGPGSYETPRWVETSHVMGGPPEKAAQKVIDSLQQFAPLDQLLEFYERFNGAELFRVYDLRQRTESPLINFIELADLEAFTNRFQTGGDLAHVINNTKSAQIYRNSDRWIAFAQFESAPCCLTIFLEGERAGQVFVVLPQPHFNNLRPIAKSFTALLDRIAKNPAAFLRLLDVHITFRDICGIEAYDKYPYYGYGPVEYVPGNGRI